ncbi:MAG: hypothetical protein AAGF01_00705 [Cyanobacteria bacterium P01_G01_bin.38]
MSQLWNRRLLLSPGCVVRTEPGLLTLCTRTEEINLETSHLEYVSRLFNGFYRGMRPINVFPTPIPTLVALIEELLGEHLVMDIDLAVDTTDPEEATTALLHEARFWARTIFEHPFFLELMAGKLGPARVLGWGVEFFHFVDAANEYMPLGVAHIRHVRSARNLIARHYVEEMNHGGFFLDGLERCGVDHASVLAAPPLPHTRALIHHLAELAIEGEVPYTAMFAVMQPGLQPLSAENINDFYTHLAKLYPFAIGLFEGFEQHALLDVDLRHDQTVFEEICRAQSGLTKAGRRRAALAMRTVSESFVQFLEGIRRSYPARGPFVPRRPMAIEACL